MSNRRKRHKHIEWAKGRTICGRTIAPGVLVKPEPAITYEQHFDRRARLGWCRACWSGLMASAMQAEADDRHDWHEAMADRTWWQ